MARIVEGSDVGTLGRFLALCEDFKVRVVKDLARIVDVWVYRSGHGGRNKHFASLMVGSYSYTIHVPLGRLAADRTGPAGRVCGISGL